jgi:hypothetical protein
LYARVVEDADAGGGEVGADEQVLAAEVGAQVRQRGLGTQVLTCDIRIQKRSPEIYACNKQTRPRRENRGARGRNVTDDVGDVEAVGEPPGGHVRGEVDPVGRRVGARRGHEVIVVAVVDEGVAEHEEGARRRGRRRSGERHRREGGGQGHEPQRVHGSRVRVGGQAGAHSRCQSSTPRKEGRRSKMVMSNWRGAKWRGVAHGALKVVRRRPSYR